MNEAKFCMNHEWNMKSEEYDTRRVRAAWTKEKKGKEWIIEFKRVFTWRVDEFISQYSCHWRPKLHILGNNRLLSTEPAPQKSVSDTDILQPVSP